MSSDVEEGRAPGLKRLVYALTAAIGMSLLMANAQAGPPQLKTQAPGFYRLMIGDFEITALSDGVFDLQTDKMLGNTTPATLHKYLARSFHQDAVATSVNAYLINTGDQLILIDAGAATLFGPTLGHLLTNLVAAGYRPEDVDTILVTHMHPDHIGGLMDDGKRVFVNATARVDRRDAAFWLSPSARDSAAPDRKAFFDGVAAAMAPYQSVGQLQTFEAPADLLPGIRAIPAPGHTPGHTIYSIESKGQKLVIWGDLMEVASIQFSQPAVTIAYDVNAREAVSQRRLAFADAARGRYLVAGAHLPFPGIGHVRKQGAAWAWVPVDYDVIR